MSEKLLTVKEVAQLFSCSEKTIHRLKNDGELEYVQIGRSVRFTSEQLRSCIMAHRHVETRGDGVQVFG